MPPQPSIPVPFTKRPPRLRTASTASRQSSRLASLRFSRLSSASIIWQLKPTASGTPPPRQPCKNSRPTRVGKPGSCPTPAPSKSSVSDPTTLEPSTPAVPRLPIRHPPHPSRLHNPKDSLPRRASNTNFFFPRGIVPIRLTHSARTCGKTAHSVENTLLPTSLPLRIDNNSSIQSF